MVRSTSSKPQGIAKDQHSYNLLMLLWKLKVLGALLDARPLKFYVDDGSGFVSRDEVRKALGL